MGYTSDLTWQTKTIAGVPFASMDCQQVDYPSFLLQVLSEEDRMWLCLGEFGGPLYLGIVFYLKWPAVSWAKLGGYTSEFQIKSLRKFHTKILSEFKCGSKVVQDLVCFSYSIVERKDFTKQKPHTMFEIHTFWEHFPSCSFKFVHHCSQQRTAIFPQ